MEPTSVQEQSRAAGKSGSLDNPEVVQDVPGYVIPILEREFDDFVTESKRFLDGQTEEAEFIGFRLRQGVYGQRQPDVQMCRIKLPWGGVTPEQMEVLADVDGGVRAAQKGPHHDAAEHPDPPHPAAADGGADPQSQRHRPLQPRGLRQHRPQRDRRPVGGRLRRRDLRPDRLRRRVRALLRAPPDDAADAAQGQDVVHRLRRRPRDHRHPRRRVPAPHQGRREGLRDARRRRHVDHAARRADALRVREGRRRRVPEGRRGRLPHLRPPGLAARQPRPRPPEGVRRQVRDRRAAQPRSRRSSRATGSTSATSTRSRACSSTTRRRTRRPSRRATAPPTATCPSSRRSAPRT